MFHEMKVLGFTIDPIAGSPMVILKDEKGDSTLPVWLKTVEVLAIAAELILLDSSARSDRKDLMTHLMEKNGASIGAIVIDRLADGTFTPFVKFIQQGEELAVEVSMCEAIITSLKYRKPMMVGDDVLERGAMIADGDCNGTTETDARRFVEFLDNLDPATLGK